MRNLIILLLLTAVAMQCTHLNKSEKSQIKYHNNFESQYLRPRNIEVYLPPAYDPDHEYPVIYMHDGQNVFNSETSNTGIDWGVDEVMDSLIMAQQIQPALVVAVWTTPDRFYEYMPQDVNYPADSNYVRPYLGTTVDVRNIRSNAYLKFLVEELKPFIDHTYSTSKRVDQTFIMGSSMGGLISAYALCKYPQVYGGAACLSTHWPELDGNFIPWFEENIPDPVNHRFYFDHGTKTLDQAYRPYQQAVDEILTKKAYVKGKSFESLIFYGAEHNEKAWHKRVHIPLQFLLKKL